MRSEEWVHQFHEILCTRLENLELGDYSSAVSANLVIILEGRARGEMPDEVAECVYEAEVKALTMP